MTSVILVAAGRGTRMGGVGDKLFLELAGRPLLAHTLEIFEKAEGIGEIVLVVRAGTETNFHSLTKQNHFTKKLRVVSGGAERQDSVWKGLQAVDPKCDIVVVHDAARPCTHPKLISDTVEAARAFGAAVAAQPVTDTVKESRDGKLISRHLDRSVLWAVQTPQTFRRDILERALARVRELGARVTDDTAACELIQQPVRLVESTHPNPKLTRPEDVPFLEWLLKNQKSTSD